MMFWPAIIKRISTWILFVAVLPSFSRADEQAQLFPSPHWSFQSILRPAPPTVRDSSWPQSPIDHFILASLEKAQLQPSPPATRPQLARRIYFDLLGLPPSPEDLNLFLNDSAPGALERLVDRLLNNPHYGERWAQHWLDVVRYAETEGFEYDRHLPDAWRFRDYVIRSFNQDKPFNQFILEQVAGDELEPGNLEMLTAAAFHRMGPIRRNAGNPDVALSRNEVLTERTDIIGSAFLGLTIGCARCHDHKIDPISQKDYYSVQAYLAATAENDVILIPEAERLAWAAQTRDINDQMRKARQEFEQTEDAQRREQLRQQLKKLESRLPPQPPTIPSIRNDFTNRTPIHVLKRGLWEQKGEPVAPRPPAILQSTSSTAELPPDFERPRTQLAQWLVHPSHPLTARVLANRIWQHHFGAGLVNSPNDFGRNGGLPSHPELLDWLASELLRNGWQLKPLHRLILLSSVYQQTSSPLPAHPGLQRDPENRLLSRFSRRRLSAEELRDAMLAVSGKLNRASAGSSVIVPVDDELVQLLYKPSQWSVSADLQARYRRSIYLIAKRNLRLPFMEVFDQPALQTSCARRESSTHAPQALELLNGAFANEMAQAFSLRLQAEAGEAHDAQAGLAFQLAAGRLPTPAELDFSRAFLKEHSLREYALAIFNLNAFLYVQ